METNRNQLLASFLERNTRLVQDYQASTLTELTVLERPFVSQISWLFRRALLASGGAVSVSQQLKSINAFRDRIRPLADLDSISFQDFTEAVLKGSNQTTPMFKLRKQLSTYSSVGEKKADLFLKELVYFLGPKVFSEFDPASHFRFLQVPIDSVHKNIYCAFHALPQFTSSKKADVRQLTANMRRWYKTLFASFPIRADDIWFWGHFSQVKIPEYTKASGRRKKIAESWRIERGGCNQEMIEVDPHILWGGFTDTESVRVLANEFTEIVIDDERSYWSSKVDIVAAESQ